MNHLLIKNRTIIGFVLCALGTQLGLVGWLLFFNVYSVGVFLVIYPAVVVSSFFGGMYVGKQQRKVRWLVGIFFLLVATVIGLRSFNLFGYGLSTIYAFSAFFFVLGGLLIQKEERLSASHNTKRFASKRRELTFNQLSTISRIVLLLQEMFDLR